MKIQDFKPQLSNPKGTRAQNNSSNTVTWSDAAFTWSDIGADWGIADSVSGEFPELLGISATRPTLVAIGDIKP